MHLSSANKKENLSVNNIKIKHNGIAIKSVKVMPAVIILLTLSVCFCALYLVINLETVIGVPLEQMVKMSANTERAT